jgi:anti-anti-sigma regulatory factor
MASTTGVFEIEREGPTLILTPTASLGEVSPPQAGSVLGLLDDSSVRNAVLDSRRTEYYSATVLGFFLELWRRLRGRGGQLALCNVSDPERQLLRLTAADSLWAVCRSREEAMQAVGG